ncbi:hypothetical protein PROVRUST_07854 [Providencia rustigianii DSM 4541]|uniref:Uncharacterized protein n=1 Tax=Providencia rustigianii DSM 4541 TaxID=500637 RepID=D1P6Q3_9GAMM|nr:hypothetical protein PROVRUST_07854 [Providencia rustigianii DSM 4541]
MRNSFIQTSKLIIETVYLAGEFPANNNKHGASYHDGEQLTAGLLCENVELGV